MPASPIARATFSPAASAPRTDISDASTPRCTALRSALKTPPPTSSDILPGFDAPGT
jgi:hypothetical protein